MIKQLKDIVNMNMLLEEDPLNEELVTVVLAHFNYSNDIVSEIIKDNTVYFQIEYLGNRLDKILSPLYMRLLEVRSKEVTAYILGEVIYQKFAEKWNRIADALFSDYNPIENYRMVEAESEGKNTKVNTEMTTETEEHETNKYSGFDSTDFKDTTATDKDGSTETTGTKAKNEQAETGNRNLSRSGNIGVTTSQQMIESELKLREHNLLNIIYNDMDSILFLDYYC